MTSDYLYFNQPKAFNELLKIPGLTVRIAKVDGFHQKGYIFQHDGYQTIIIGSANLTENALMRNYEWSL
ncbi:phospholipase D-like domain-containing protein, partial [Bifidobacterium longum]|nr:phospholipase D-like domain-containing protein [Bifidobacterium longum]